MIHLGRQRGEKGEGEGGDGEREREENEVVKYNVIITKIRCTCTHK